MYLWNVLRNLLHFWTLGEPLSVLFPVVFLGAAILHGFFLWSTGRPFKWSLLILSAGIVLVCEVSIWLIRSYAALLIVAVMHFALAALLGTLFVTFFYKLWTKVRHS